MYHSFFLSSCCRLSRSCAIPTSNDAVCALQRGVFRLVLLKQRLCGGIGRTWVICALPAWCIQPTPHNIIREASLFFPTIPGGWEINPRHISAQACHHLSRLYCTPSTIIFPFVLVGIPIAAWRRIVGEISGALYVLPSENLCHLMSR